MKPYEIDSAMTNGELTGSQLRRLAELLTERTGVQCVAVTDSYNGARIQDDMRGIITERDFWAAVQAIAEG